MTTLLPTTNADGKPVIPMTDEQKYWFDIKGLSLFTCYNTVNAKWGKGSVAPEVIAAMKPKRQTLFRGVWTAYGEGERSNRYYSEANRAV
jgi:hypothetical protein